MNDKLLNQLEKVMQDGVKSADQANDLLAQCYNAITDLIDAMPADRTEKQSSSRWLYLEEMARQLNDAGIDRQRLITVIKENAKINAPNTKDTLYLDYWRPVHESIYTNKRLTKEQIQIVHETMNNHAANTFGVSAAWPDRFNR